MATLLPALLPSSTPVASRGVSPGIPAPLPQTGHVTQARPITANIPLETVVNEKRHLTRTEAVSFTSLCTDIGKRKVSFLFLSKSLNHVVLEQKQHSPQKCHLVSRVLLCPKPAKPLN